MENKNETWVSLPSCNSSTMSTEAMTLYIHLDSVKISSGICQLWRPIDILFIPYYWPFQTGFHTTLTVFKKT